MSGWQPPPKMSFPVVRWRKDITHSYICGGRPFEDINVTSTIGSSAAPRCGCGYGGCPHLRKESPEGRRPHYLRFDWPSNLPMSSVMAARPLRIAAAELFTRAITRAVSITEANSMWP
jgi:hypothetical protein